MKEHVLNHVDRDASVSMRQMGEELNVSCMTIWRVLHEHEQQFCINVWAGIVDDCLKGPHVLPHQLTGNHYLDVKLQDFPLAVRAQTWDMHDCAPAHFTVLCEMFLMTPIMANR
jgi:hypothetical protein